MWKGTLVSINIASSGSAPMQSVRQVRALPGIGLEGDRYATRQGTYSDKDDGSRQVTLIEIEAIEALQREAGIHLSPGEARRNLVTRGAPLNHLVGKTFWVGEVALRGIRLCEPCQHLSSLTQAGVLPGLIHRGGLRAEILNEGIIREGDPITDTIELRQPADE
jgi:MOSC domain-containing protein YiiM